MFNSINKLGINFFIYPVGGDGVHKNASFRGWAAVSSRERFEVFYNFSAGSWVKILFIKLEKDFLS